MLNNLKFYSKLCFLFALSIAWEAFPQDASPVPSLHLYYFASRFGEIEPCGCETMPRGGLVRLQNALLLDPFSKVLVDGGDSFFENEKIASFKLETERLKAMKLAEGYAALGLSVLAPGARDFALGTQFLSQLQQLSKASFIASDLESKEGTPLFEKYKVIEKNGIRMGVFSLSDDSIRWKELGVTRLPTDRVLDEAASYFNKEKVDYIVCLSHLGFPEDEKLAAKRKIDFIVGTKTLEGFSLPVERGNTWISQQAPYVKEVSFFELSKGKNGRPVTHDLDASYEGKNLMTELIRSYHSENKETVISNSSKREVSTKSVAKKSVAKKEPEKPYVANPFYCKTCHEKQFDFWAGTKHSSAYLVLFSKNQHFDPECIGCHSLGFASPTGFEDVLTPYQLAPGASGDKQELFIEAFFKEVFSEDKNETPLDSRKEPKRYAKLHEKYHKNLKKWFEEKKIEKWYVGVSCEHCHGNRQGHPSPTWKKVKIDESKCRVCHRPPNAPEFDPSRIKEVSCPKIKN